jgi:predicted RNA methylase
MLVRFVEARRAHPANAAPLASFNVSFAVLPTEANFSGDELMEMRDRILGPVRHPEWSFVVMSNPPWGVRRIF